MGIKVSSHWGHRDCRWAVVEVVAVDFTNDVVRYVYQTETPLRWGLAPQGFVCKGSYEGFLDSFVPLNRLEVLVLTGKYIKDENE